MSSRRLVTLLIAVLAFALLPAGAAYADPPPARFTADPESPFEDQPVTFTAQAKCEGNVLCVWSSRGVVVGTGKRLVQTYADPGTYRVRLDVARVNGKGDILERADRVLVLNVQPAPAAPPAPPAPPAPAPPAVPPAAPPAPNAPVGGSGGADRAPAPPAAPPAASPPAASPVPAAPLPSGSPGTTPPTRPAGESRIMSPFPVVRVAGSVGARGTRLTLFSVRGPRSARVIVRCVGRNRGCPFRRREHLVRPSLDRALKLRGRLLRPGAMLDIRVVQAGRVGKRTTLRFRDRRGPTRTDGCVTPAGGVRRCG
jgi:hypothetical protein